MTHQTMRAFTCHQLGRTYVLTLSKAARSRTEGDDKRARHEERQAERILWALRNRQDTSGLHDLINGTAAEAKRQLQLHRDTTRTSTHLPTEQDRQP